MCGIAGIISEKTSLVQEDRIERMTKILEHRGPNGQRLWINNEGTVAFGHRRLSVIDLSEAASEPLQYLHYTVVLNGEIYNYIELKEELQNKGYSFRTSSDVEIIPAAYDCWKENCLNHFDGMFAFALYDSKEQQTFIARDRFGEKPLFYCAKYLQRGKFDQFLFASEMKSLWAAGVEKQLNGTMMLNYITLGYIHNPLKKTETFYTNILSLPPGYYLKIHVAEGKINMKRWYFMGDILGKGVETKEEETFEKFRELLFTSVKRRLRSDVSVGSSLSGGIDSSCILASVRSLTPKDSPFTVFSAIFPGFANDEFKYSKQVADHLGVQQYTVTPTENDWVECWDKLVYHQEEPMQSSSVLSQYMVYQLAKEKGVTVLLDGQGADEVLGGYKKFVHWYLQQIVFKDHATFKKEKKLLQQNGFLDKWGLGNYAASALPFRTSWILQERAVQQQNLHGSLNKDFLHTYQNKDTLKKPIVEKLEDILYYNTFTIGLQELLRYADRNSMAHSREVRLPYLNHELVEYIFSLQSSYKIRDGYTKWILRKSFDSYLPKDIVWRTGKIGYEPPQQQWMQNRVIQEMIVEAKKTLVNKNILSPSALDKSIKPKSAHEAGNYDWRYLCAAEMF